MDRLLLYLGGLLLLVGLASIPLWMPATRNEVPANVQPIEPPPPAAKIGGAFHRGVVLGVFPHGSERPGYRQDFREIRALGANAVSLNFNWFMNSVRDATVYRGQADADNQTPHDDILKQAINDAHAEGLRVMMFPSVYLLQLAEGEWRGTIRPPDWPTWFASYRALIVSLARLCEAFGVEYLCIGIELISSERFTEEWRRIIEEVRAVYQGEVLYSANWDARRRNPWYRDLDQIAMNAYYTLSRSRNPVKAELVQAWRRIRQEIAPWREWVGRPLIISEIGYRSADGTISAPWNYFMRGNVNLAEQDLAYDAFFTAWFDDDLFQGVYIYQWFGEGGPTDTDYTPRGKPAQATLTRWFGTIAQREHERAADGERASETQTPQTQRNTPAGTAEVPGTSPALPAGMRPLAVRAEPQPAVRVSGWPQRWWHVGDELQPQPNGPRVRIEAIEPAFGFVTVRDVASGDVYQLIAPAPSDAAK